MKTWLCILLLVFSAVTQAKRKEAPIRTDREVWCDIMYRMAHPVLKPMSEGNLLRDMPLELSPNWGKRDKRVAYMECFGRLMCGLAPWLTLPDDNTTEGKQRKQLREWALKSYAQAVNPESPDYLLWRKESQPLVDAAFLAQSLIRGYDVLWTPLDSATKQRYIQEFKLLRRITPFYTNWLLFTATIEAFLLKAGEEADMYRITMALNKVNEWYVGDGWYSDGPHFAFDYYNSFVIQPMYVEILEVMKGHYKSYQKTYDTALQRMQRYSVILERLISPEGTFPVFGRSITYRTGVFHPLALLAWQQKLPDSLSNGQVRAGLTAVFIRMFAGKQNFDEKDFLRLGFNGHQTGVANGYTNNGSLYLATFSFLPLGLPNDHPFWTDEPQSWTSKKAWEGEDFPMDHAMY